MRIAVLGMGRMGRALAGRLLRGGHTVTVWNRTPGRAAEVVAAGGTESGTVTDAVRDAQIVVTVLTDDAAVRAVALGELRPVLAESATYIDCSTISAALTGELAATFPDRFLAVPVAGAPTAVAAGTAVLLIGGPDVVVERVAPMIATVSETTRRFDTAQQAIAAKLANNLLLVSGIVALAEAFAVGRAGGLSDDRLRELLDGPLVAPGLRNRFDGVLTGSGEGWWNTVLGAKDAGLAADLAASEAVSLPLAEVVRARYEQAAAAGFGDADIAAVANLYDRAADPRN